MRPLVSLLFWTSCARHPGSLERLIDPCAGEAIPVVHALSPSLLVLGCSDGRGLWWSADRGNHFEVVPGAGSWSVLDLVPEAGGRLRVVGPADRPTAMLDVSSGTPRLGPAAPPPSPGPASGPDFSFPGHLRGWTQSAESVLAVGSVRRRPHDGLAAASADGGASWIHLTTDPPVLESVTRAGAWFWLAGDDYLARGMWPFSSVDPPKQRPLASPCASSPPR